MTKVNLESEAEETVGATEEDILDVIESDEITADLVEASKEANEAAEADQELTELQEEVVETIGDIEEKLEDTAEVQPEDVAGQTIYVPRIGNSIAVYDPTFRYDSYADYVDDYDVSDILSERGKAVADKYGLDDVLKAYNALDSKVSNVMGNLDKALSLTNNVKRSISESTAIDKDIAIYFKGSMRLMQDLIKFFFDYQKYLVATVNLINQNTVNK